MQPGWLEWVGSVSSILGVLAFLMGFGPFAQWIWGRPMVKTRFERDVQGSDRSLMVFFENPPVKNRILKRLVHRRSVESLVVQYRVSEVGSGKIIVPIRQLRIYSDEDTDLNGRMRITLPPTISVASNAVPVFWNDQTKTAILPDSRTRLGVSLGPGLYRADFVVSIDGRPCRISRTFVVGDGADDLNWVPTK